MQAVLTISTIVAGGVGGKLADLAEGLWDMSSLSELWSALLPTVVAETLDMESLGEKLIEKGREYLVDELAKRITKDANELVEQWTETVRDWQKFTVNRPVSTD